MSFIDDEFISRLLSLHIYLCFLVCSRWEPNSEDPEEWIIGTTSWCWCGLMPDKSPSAAHFSLCDAAAQWRAVHHVSAFDLAAPGKEGRCCGSLSSLFNERLCHFLCHQVGNKMWVWFCCFDIKISSQERMGWSPPTKDNFVLLCQDSVLVWFIPFFPFWFDLLFWALWIKPWTSPC